MDITYRALCAADIPSWNELLAAVEAVEHTGEHYNEADLVEEMANPDVDPATDMAGAFADGRMVGYWSVYARSGAEDYHKVHLEGAVHPDWRGRGIGTVLTEAMMRRAEAAHAERYPALPCLHELSGMADNREQRELVAGVGLVPERWSFTMRAQLDAVADPPPLPAGFELRRYDDTFAAAMFEAHNEVFRDHPNFTPWTPPMWEQWVTGSRSFRPQDSYLVLDTTRAGRIAAYVQTSEYDAYLEATGRREAYVGKVGTRREYRGRGLATSLLAHCLSAYRAGGYDEAGLDVDSQNPTGALGVYERAGFLVESRHTDYARRVPAPAPVSVAD